MLTFHWRSAFSVTQLDEASGDSLLQAGDAQVASVSLGLVPRDLQTDCDRRLDSLMRDGDHASVSRRQSASWLARLAAETGACLYVRLTATVFLRDRAHRAFTNATELAERSCALSLCSLVASTAAVPSAISEAELRRFSMLQAPVWDQYRQTLGRALLECSDLQPEPPTAAEPDFVTFLELVARLSAVDALAECMRGYDAESTSRASALASLLVERGIGEALAFYAARSTWAASTTPFPQPTAAFFKVRARYAALRLLFQMTMNMIATGPLHKEQAAFFVLALRVALPALRSSSPSLRAVASVVVSYTTQTWRSKREAIAAGALPPLCWLARNDGALFARYQVCCRALAAAGNIAYAVDTVEQAEPLLSTLLMAIDDYRGASADRLADERDMTMLFNAAFALGQLSHYAEVRPWFESASTRTSLDTLRAVGARSVMSVRIAELDGMLQRILARPPPCSFAQSHGPNFVGVGLRATGDSDTGSLTCMDWKLSLADDAFSAEATRKQVCASCGAGAGIGGPQQTPLRRCGRCKLAYYCSTACQSAEWGRHRKVCVKAVASGS